MTTDRFLDRAAELRTLDEAYAEPGARLVLVWGRRRTGKTRLLGRFVHGRLAIFYGATQQSPAAELGGFSAAVREILPPGPTDLLAHGDLPSWESALDYVVDRAGDRRIVVVIDEFPYLVASQLELPSIVQRFWDHRGRTSQLMLVLCGSTQSVMLEMQARNAPLFGRVDRRLHLQPFGYADAGLFVPLLTPTEKAISYGVVGGMPVYLSRWRDDQGHVANLRRLFGDPSSPLVEEGEFVLTSELPEAAGYFRIMHAIARGNRTFSRIRAFADIDISRQLNQLIDLGLVEREVPVTDDPLRSKRAVYRIGDNFLRFWFRFIYRRRADIARGLGREVVDRTVVPALSDHMGEPWEEMCREHVRRLAVAGTLPVDVSTVGRWWNRDNSVEVDVVGLAGKRVVLAGSAKWSASLGRSALSRLRRSVDGLPNAADDVQLALFARERVQSVDRSEALIFTAADLYGRARGEAGNPPRGAVQ